MYGRTKQKKRKSERDKLIFCSTKKGERCSSGYPPAEGRVEHSQRNSSQENYIIFSLETKKRITEEEKGKRQTEEGCGREEGEGHDREDKEEEEEEEEVWGGNQRV